MSRVIIPTPADLLLSTSVRALPRLREPTLRSRLDDLRAMARSLLTELESLGLPVELEPDGKLNLDDELKRYEIGLIRAALDKAGGSQTRAARMLGVKVTTLNTKIKRYQIMRRKS
jgi:transcriptional regulator with GAF, ATPase, and Fis domain